MTVIVCTDVRHWCVSHVHAVDERPFGATLVWTDPAASIQAYLQLVNNLDLTVARVDGQVRHTYMHAYAHADTLRID